MPISKPKKVRGKKNTQRGNPNISISTWKSSYSSIAKKNRLFRRNKKKFEQERRNRLYGP